MPRSDYPRTTQSNDPKQLLAELWEIVNDVIDYLTTGVGGPMTQVLVAGAVAGDVTVTGIATTDTIVSVIHNTAGALADLTSEFTIDSADTINNDGGTATDSDDLLVTYQSVPNAGTVPAKMSI